MRVGGQRHAPVALPQEGYSVPIVQEAEWTPGPVWTGAVNIPPTGIRSLARPARSDSRDRLSYRGTTQTGRQQYNGHYRRKFGGSNAHVFGFG